MKLRLTALVFILLFAAFQYVHYVPLLPDTVASHFGASGSANGWSTKASFFSVYILSLFVAGVLFAGISPVLRRLPVSMLNLPNKAHWLAAERRDATWRYIGTRMMDFGNVTLVLLVSVFELTLRANLMRTPRLNPTAVWMLLAAYLVFVAVWLWRFITRFLRTGRSLDTRLAAQPREGGY
jgi:uncharacterized membrane protein